MGGEREKGREKGRDGSGGLLGNLEYLEMLGPEKVENSGLIGIGHVPQGAGEGKEGICMESVTSWERNPKTSQSIPIFIWDDC